MPAKKTKTNGDKPQKIEWEYNGETIDHLSKTPKGSIGFIYKISLLDGSGRYYVGRKTMTKPVAKSGVNKGKSTGEYTWRTYCGSSKELLKIIKEEKPKYKKEILYFCFSKSEMSYMESREILCSGALTDPLAFNFWIKTLIYSKNLTPNS
jgi:hypothetical protein